MEPWPRCSFPMSVVLAAETRVAVCVDLTSVVAPSVGFGVAPASLANHWLFFLLSRRFFGWELRFARCFRLSPHWQMVKLLVVLSACHCESVTRMISSSHVGSLIGDARCVPSDSFGGAED